MFERVQRERIWREAVLAGDALAWQQGYETAFAPLARYVRWRCAGLQAIAEDVIQESWLIAVRSIRKFDPQAGSFLDWLRGIAANLIRNQLRKRHRRGTHETLPNELPSNRNHPDLERAEKIALALSELPDRQERVLRAKYVEQRSVREIARDWNETEKAIESLLTRAREAFRQAYGSDE
jgi:RNA polymerase sigma-70 factor (ECF subfamily)